MTNRDLLKEAIADAKAVKETAIANAKAALEESFGPFLQQTLAAKLMEIDAMEEEEKLEEIDEMVDKNELEEYAEDQPESPEKAHYIPKHAKKTEKAKESIEEMDLEALLKELDEMEMSTEESINEEEKLINDPKYPENNDAKGNVAEAGEVDMTVDTDSDGIPDEMDDDINIEEMSTEDLESFIKEVIADMVKAGELEAGHEDMGEEKNEEGKEGKEDEKGKEDEEEIDVDELVAEIRKQKEKDSEKEEMAKMKEELEEAYTALKTIKTELNEVNLFNAKLLYTNKIFRAKNLSENQKVKVLAAFDKAASIKEAKLVFETLSEGLNQPKAPVNESLLRGAASKVTGVAPKKPILEVNNQFSRWQTLAGIKK